MCISTTFFILDDCISSAIYKTYCFYYIKNAKEELRARRNVHHVESKEECPSEQGGMSIMLRDS